MKFLNSSYSVYLDCKSHSIIALVWFMISNSMHNNNFMHDFSLFPMFIVMYNAFRPAYTLYLYLLAWAKWCCIVRARYLCMIVLIMVEVLMMLFDMHNCLSGFCFHCLFVSSVLVCYVNICLPAAVYVYLNAFLLLLCYICAIWYTCCITPSIGVLENMPRFVVYTDDRKHMFAFTYQPLNNSF